MSRETMTHLWRRNPVQTLVEFNHKLHREKLDCTRRHHDFDAYLNHIYLKLMIDRVAGSDTA